MDNNNQNYRLGELPGLAPLALSFTPFQFEGAPRYNSSEALKKGTLFPGLDLPWKNVVNKDHPYSGTPYGDLMELSFVVDELKLYLDTHQNDKEAFAVLQDYLKLEKEARKRFLELYGPISDTDLLQFKRFNWLDDPWPWEYSERE